MKSLKFYIRIVPEKNNLLLKNPNLLQIGDTINILSYKYELYTKRFLGKTFTLLEIGDVLGNDMYDCILTKRLDFEEKGMAVVQGLTKFVIRIENGVLTTFNPVKTAMTLTGGTGMFTGASGIYTSKVININESVGKLKFTTMIHS